MLGAAASDRSRARRATVLLGTALVLTAGGVVAAGRLDLSRVLAVVRTADPGLLALAVAGYLLSWPLRGRRYGTLLGATGHRCRVGFLTAAVSLVHATPTC